MIGDLTPAEALIPGVDFDFGGGRVLTVPPISFGALERMRERLNAMPKLQATDPEAQSTIIDSVHAALKRNYPQMSRDYVAELIDVANMFEVYTCVMDIGGMVRRQREADRQGATSGNEQATGRTTGAGSSPE